MPNTEINQASADFNFVEAIASYFGERYTHFTRELAHTPHPTAVNWALKGELPPWRGADIMDAAKKLPKSDQGEIKSLLDWGI